MKDKIAEIIDLNNHDGLTPNKAAEEVIKFLKDGQYIKECNWCDDPIFDDHREFEVNGKNACLKCYVSTIKTDGYR